MPSFQVRIWEHFLKNLASLELSKGILWVIYCSKLASNSCECSTTYIEKSLRQKVLKSKKCKKDFQCRQPTKSSLEGFFFGDQKWVWLLEIGHFEKTVLLFALTVVLAKTSLADGSNLEPFFNVVEDTLNGDLVLFAGERHTNTFKTFAVLCFSSVCETSSLNLPTELYENNMERRKIACAKVLRFVLCYFSSFKHAIIWTHTQT